MLVYPTNVYQVPHFLLLEGREEKNTKQTANKQTNKPTSIHPKAFVIDSWVERGFVEETEVKDIEIQSMCMHWIYRQTDTLPCPVLMH